MIDEKDTAIDALPKIRGGLYRHYKGGLYWIPGIVILAEDSLERLVPYFSLLKRTWWARTFSNFGENIPVLGMLHKLNGTVESSTYPIPRFERVGGHLAAFRVALRECHEKV